MVPAFFGQACPLLKLGASVIDTSFSFPKKPESYMRFSLCCWRGIGAADGIGELCGESKTPRIYQGVR
jgi:hypothetical protein